ncbi:MAG: outer membrane protein transport protein [Salinibacter sp.]
MHPPRSTVLAFSLPLLFGFLLAVQGPTAAHAQGFSVYEQGTCTMAQAGAAVAQPCNDGSAVFYSPAGLLESDGITISGGATMIAAQGSFTSDYTRAETDLQNDPILVPHLYGAYRLSPDLALGLGVYVPYGLETQWPSTWDGAFEGYDNGVQAIYIQPTAAYQLTDRIRVGGGPILGISSVTLNQRLDASSQEVPSNDVPDGTTFGNLGIPFHTAFADAGLEGDGATAFGAHLGITAEATDWLDVGVRYLTPITFEYEGEATFDQIDTGLQLPDGNPITGQSTPLDLVLDPAFVNGPLVNQSLETELTMPAQVVAGVAIQATERLLLQADYQWTGWSSFDSIELIFENEALNQTRREAYDNTSAVRFGGAYDATDALTVRAGYLFNQAAAPDRTVTPLLPESDRNHFTAGVNWQIIDTVGLNVAYQYLGQNDRRGRVRDARPGEDAPTAEDLNSGLYTFNAHLVGTTVTISL